MKILNLSNDKLSIDVDRVEVVEEKMEGEVCIKIRNYTKHYVIVNYSYQEVLDAIALARTEMSTITTV